MPKAIAISCSKNDGDIIEAFVRHNSRFVDKFCIVDESIDGTRDILNALRSEGFDIDVYENPYPTYQQDLLLNSALKTYAGIYDYYFCLDVDEILQCSDIEAWSRSEGLSEEAILRMYWDHFVPVVLTYPNLENPLKNGFCRLVGYKHRIQKIAIPSSFSGKCLVSVGSHNALIANDNRLVMAPERDWFFSIAHFPVRSSHQIAYKTIKSVSHMRLKKGKNPKEGHHVYQILRFIQSKNFNLGLEDLMYLAITYGAPDIADISSAKVRLEVSLDIGDIELRYRDLVRLDLTSLLYGEIDEFIEMLGGDGL
jgi:hypothetical protein